MTTRRASYLDLHRQTAAEAQGGGEVSRFMPSDADRHRCYNCGLRIADHVPDEDGARCKREAVRQLREITAPPSAPVGVEALRDLRDRVLPAALRHHANGPGYIEEAQEIVTRALAQQPAADDFCDGHCTWLDHAPGCPRHEAQQPAVVDEVEGLKRLVRHLTCNPDFDFAAALAAQPGGAE